MKYLSFIDILGTKNMSRNNLEEYLDSIINFQQALIRNAQDITKNGRIHFFSDCAYIECEKLSPLVTFLTNLRDELLDSNIFLKGSIINGILGAVNGRENIEEINKMYQSEDITAKFNKLKTDLNKYSKTISGTVFYSSDIGIAYKHQDELKGIGIFIEESIADEIRDSTINSMYLSDMNSDSITPFFDLKYDPDILSEYFLKNIFNQYTLANTYSSKYGRYYLTLLISFINSCNYSEIDYDKTTGKFINFPLIFERVIRLRLDYRILYDKTVGLEFVFFALLNKYYLDNKQNNEITKRVLKSVLMNRKFLGKYLNNLSKVPTYILSSTSKSLMLKDYFSILKENIKEQ